MPGCRNGEPLGGHITTLPDDLSRLMLVALKQPVDLNEEIEGDVTL